MLVIQDKCSWLQNRRRWVIPLAALLFALRPRTKDKGLVSQPDRRRDGVHFVFCSW